MNVFRVLKDVILLPVDMVLDVTYITPMIRSMTDDESDTPFGTIDRLRSMVRNIEDNQ